DNGIANQRGRAVRRRRRTGRVPRSPRRQRPCTLTAPRRCGRRGGMNQFARIVIGYHGCRGGFAPELLLGTKPVRDWKPSTNDWDWLGHGIYFWEHSPERALRWAQEQGQRHGHAPGVVGAVLQLGRCFDLLNEAITQLLAQTYQELAQVFAG